MALIKNPYPSGAKKRVRMRDVATRCGVSISTVSLVLSGDARIPEDTTRKVLQTVKAMEYRPSVLARSLAKRGSRTLAVILPETAFKKNQAYYYQVLNGIQSQAQPAGYKMLVEAASRIFLERRYYLRLLKEQSADGIIYLTANSRDTFLSDMTRENYPFVLLGNRVDGVDLPMVGGDDIGGAKMATQHLISLGHKAIGHVAGSPETSIGRDREKGYRAAMQEAGIAIQPSWVVLGDFDIQQAEKTASQLAQTKVTAVFAGSDMMAYGLMKGFQALKMRVPEDVAVVGIDDLEFSAWMNPSLTTVKMDHSQMGTLATEFILKKLENSLTSRNLLNAVPPPLLVTRNSCGSKH